MAVIINCANPAGLLQKIKKAIDDKQVVTWSYDSDGDFTHDTEQWRLKAWLRPKVAATTLTFGVLTPKDTKMSSVVYGVYHGRFIEMLVTHFDKDLTTASATALPVTGVDRISG